MLSRFRQCGCDCRDDYTYVPNPAVRNASSCTSCGGEKPPCLFVAHFECRLTATTGEELAGPGTSYLSTVTGLQQASVGNFPGDVQLRPICEFRNPCVYVSYGGLSHVDRPLGIMKQSGCSWLSRVGYSTGTVADVTRKPSWRMDISSNPVTMSLTIRSETAKYTCQDGFDCFGANDFVMTSPRPSWGPTLPSRVCVTPGFSQGQTRGGDSCCPNCFEAEIPAMFGSVSVSRTTFPFTATYAISIPEQTLQFLPLPGALCAYFAPLILSSTPSNTPSFALLEIARSGSLGTRLSFMFGGLYGITNWPAVKIASYYAATASFSCNGGTLNRFVDSNLYFGLNTPASLTLTKSEECNISEVDDEGGCTEFNVRKAHQESGYPYGVRQTYDTEENRVSCCDPNCDAIRLRLYVYIDSTSSQPYSAFDGIAVTDYVGAPTGLSSPSGPSRATTLFVVNACVGVVVYCSSGVWKCDYYCTPGPFCSGFPTNFVATTTLATECCPLRGGDGGTNLTCIVNNLSTPAHGCVSIGESYPNCAAIGCCTDASEANCFLTFTSSCADFNGVSVSMNRVGSHHWTGRDSVNEAGLDLTCNNGTWTLVYGTVGSCLFTLTSGNIRCSPIMSGTFPITTINSFFCCAGTSFTISATVSP